MTHFEPMGGPFFKIPADSNLRWMVMFYALPREFVEKQPVLLDMPRKIRDVIKSEKWMELVNSDVFLELIWDSYAWISWQFFEVPMPVADACRCQGLSISIPATSLCGAMHTWYLR